MSSVIDLGGGVIMSKRDAAALVRAIKALPREEWEGTSSFLARIYEHFRKHDALGVLMDLQDATKRKEEAPL